MITWQNVPFCLAQTGTLTCPHWSDCLNGRDILCVGVCVCVCARALLSYMMMPGSPVHGECMSCVGCHPYPDLQREYRWKQRGDKSLRGFWWGTVCSLVCSGGAGCRRRMAAGSSAQVFDGRSAAASPAVHSNSIAEQDSSPVAPLQLL